MRTSACAGGMMSAHSTAARKIAFMIAVRIMSRAPSNSIGNELANGDPCHKVPSPGRAGNAGFGKCGRPATIRAVLAIALDLAPDAALRFVIDPVSSPRIDRLENGWCVGAVNQR